MKAASGTLRFFDAAWYALLARLRVCPFCHMAPQS